MGGLICNGCEKKEIVEKYILWDLCKKAKCITWVRQIKWTMIKTIAQLIYCQEHEVHILLSRLFYLY